MSNKNPEVNLQFLQQLARDLLFELNDKQCQDLLLEFDAIEEQMANVKKINTDNVQPLDFPFDIKRSFLRSDTVEKSLAVRDVLSVAADTKDGYIVVNKVISDEE